MKYKFTEEKVPAIKTKIDSSVDESVNEEVLKLVRTLKLVQIGLNHDHELSIEVEEIQPIKIERLNPPPAPIIKKRKWLIKFPKIDAEVLECIARTNMGDVHNELKTNKLFLKCKKACEV